MRSEEKQALSSWLAQASIHAARLMAYVETRYGMGCGDQGHQAAVKTSNRTVAKVRRALGFTYPKDDITF